MSLRIPAVTCALVLTLAGLNAGQLRTELSHLRYDLHRLRHHFGLTNDQPGQSVSSLPLSPVDRIVVNTAKVQRTIPAGFFGINYSAFWDKAQGSRASAQALAQTSIRTVRFPGGAPSDWYDWQDPYYKGWSTTSPDQLWKFVRSSGGQRVLFSTNVQGHVPNPPGKRYAANSPENAAAWVKYNRRAHIAADMEVGNEEDLLLLKTADDPAYQQYINTFNAQARAMHHANRSVRVLGPAGTNEWYWWRLDGLGMFLQQTGNRTGTGQVDGVSLHFYRGPNWLSVKDVAQYWLSSGGPWSTIQRMIHAHDTRHLPVYLTEWNLGGSTYNDPFMPTLGHALAVTDLIGAFAVSGVAGEDYFTLHSGTSYGLLYGSGESRPVDTPTPTYYAMVLWRQMGNRVVSLQQSDDPAQVTSAYATTRRDHSVQILLINKRSTARTVRIEIHGQTPAGHRLRAYTLRGTSGGVDDATATYNGKAMPSPQERLPGPTDLGVVGGSALSYRVPGYSAVVLQLTGLGHTG